jgi:hypothetical protein
MYFVSEVTGTHWLAVSVKYPDVVTLFTLDLNRCVEQAVVALYRPVVLHMCAEGTRFETRLDFYLFWVFFVFFSLTSEFRESAAKEVTTF